MYYWAHVSYQCNPIRHGRGNSNWTWNIPFRPGHRQVGQFEVNADPFHGVHDGHHVLKLHVPVGLDHHRLVLRIADASAQAGFKGVAGDALSVFFTSRFITLL